MKCAPRQLKTFLASQGHECRTAQENGWSGIKNGELLALADSQFQVLVTIDRGIRYQQNMTGGNIGIVIVRGQSNRLADLVPHFPACAEALRNIRPGQVVEAGGT